MPDTKISGLTAATTLASTDELPANQSGNSRKLTLAQVLEAGKTVSLPYVPMLNRLVLESTERALLLGIGRLALYGSGTDAALLVLGMPKAPAAQSFTVLAGYEYIVQQRLTLTQQCRAMLAGDCDMILTEDFGQRSRIVLTGRG